VVNHAHSGIRNQELDKALAEATDTGERYDLVVVGCGLSGLTAGFTFNKEHPNGSVLLLDQHPIFGGEAKQNDFEVDGYHLTAPQGSTGITVPFSIRKKFGTYPQLAQDLGFPDEFEFQQPTGLNKDILIPHDPWLPMQLNWDQSDIGYFYEGVGWLKNVYRNGFRDTPMSQEANAPG